jgi:predicted alpha/beta hydrolase family esterase
MDANRQVLFIQGGGAGTHDEWDNKLVESLKRELGSDCEIRYPRMPDEDDPHYATWKPALQTELARLNESAVLVGHSIGGTMLVNVLAERAISARFSALILIAAPFVGQGGWPSEEFKSQENLGAKLPRDLPVHIFHGLNDETAPPSHANLYACVIPQARVHRIAGRDHQFNNDMKEVALSIKGLSRSPECE